MVDSRCPQCQQDLSNAGQANLVVCPVCASRSAYCAHCRARQIVTSDDSCRACQETFTKCLCGDFLLFQEDSQQWQCPSCSKKFASCPHQDANGARCEHLVQLQANATCVSGHHSIRCPHCQQMTPILAKSFLLFCRTCQSPLARCPQCQKPFILQTGETHCPYCRHAFQHCPTPGCEALLPGNDYGNCAFCKASYLLCPACHAPNRGNAAFCRQCGRRVFFQPPADYWQVFTAETKIIHHLRNSAPQNLELDLKDSHLLYTKAGSLRSRPFFILPCGCFLHSGYDYQTRRLLLHTSLLFDPQRFPREEYLVLDYASTANGSLLIASNRSVWALEPTVPDSPTSRHCLLSPEQLETPLQIVKAPIVREEVLVLTMGEPGTQRLQLRSYRLIQEQEWGPISALQPVDKIELALSPVNVLGPFALGPDLLLLSPDNLLQIGLSSQGQFSVQTKSLGSQVRLQWQPVKPLQFSRQLAMLPGNPSCHAEEAIFLAESPLNREADLPGFTFYTLSQHPQWQISCYQHPLLLPPLFNIFLLNGTIQVLYVNNHCLHVTDFAGFNAAPSQNPEISEYFRPVVIAPLIMCVAKDHTALLLFHHSTIAPLQFLKKFPLQARIIAPPVVVLDQILVLCQQDKEVRIKMIEFARMT